MYCILVIKHFQQIKNYSNSLLFVSITADKFVIKSTNRPYFNLKIENADACCIRMC